MKASYKEQQQQSLARWVVFWTKNSIVEPATDLPQTDLRALISSTLLSGLNEEVQLSS